MNKTLVVSDCELFTDTVKLFVKNDASKFLYKTESLLNFPSEFFQFCKTENISNIILFESNQLKENFIIRQKKYANLYDLISNIKIDKLITFIDVKSSNFENKVLNEDSIFNNNIDTFNTVDKFLFSFNNLINKSKIIDTKCITVFHGELYGRKQNDSIFSFYLEKFQNAKNNLQSQIEITEHQSNEYQLTFIDNLIDIVLFLLYENDKINKIEKLYWNVGSPEIIKVSDIVHVLSMFFEEIDVTFKGKAAKKESKFVSTEKFISEFVQYPYIKFNEVVKLILTE
jgi:hypothetical protein